MKKQLSYEERNEIIDQTLLTTQDAIRGVFDSKSDDELNKQWCYFRDGLLDDPNITNKFWGNQKFRLAFLHLNNICNEIMDGGLPDKDKSYQTSRERMLSKISYTIFQDDDLKNDELTGYWLLLQDAAKAINPRRHNLEVVVFSISFDIKIIIHALKECKSTLDELGLEKGNGKELKNAA